MSEEYVFRYRINTGAESKQAAYRHQLTEFTRKVLEGLLDIVTPLESDKAVTFDGFRWLKDSEGGYQIFSPASPGTSPPGNENVPAPSDSTEKGVVYQDARNAAFYEPRIGFIKQLLESLLSLIELENGGKTVQVDGFRLKNLRDWLVTNPGDASDLLTYTGTRCNCDCTFCCNKGNPATLASDKATPRSAEDEWKEIKTRVELYSPAANQGLFPSSGSVYEETTHPYFPEALKLVRQKTSALLKITSNGRNLTPGTISILSQSKPVYIHLSLNSASPSRRRLLMNDSNPEAAINALPLLRQQEIPYAAVIVPWPVDSIAGMLDDLRTTAKYAAGHDAHIIQVNLPGYSGHFSPAGIFNLDEVWGAVVSCVRELRGDCTCPVVIMPSLYEENIYQARKNLPQVAGVVRNSPAATGGIKIGDIIAKVNGIPVLDRPQARDLLHMVHQGDLKEVSLTVKRGTQTVEIVLDPAYYSYPYTRETDAYLGIVFNGSGLRRSYLESLRDIIRAHKAHRVLFLSSRLVRPAFEECLAETNIFGDQCSIDIEVPENRFFGGNICMGDLLVVQDFIDCIHRYVKDSGRRPDLVIIPSSPFNLSGWRRDLTGRTYLQIERETGIPVELLDCATMYS